MPSQSVIDRVVRIERREDDVHVRRTSRPTGRRRRSASATRPRRGSPRARRTGTRSARGRGSGPRRRRGPGRPGPRGSSAGPGRRATTPQDAPRSPTSRTAAHDGRAGTAPNGATPAPQRSVGDLGPRRRPTGRRRRGCCRCRRHERPGVVGVDREVRVAAAGDDDLLEQAGVDERRGRRELDDRQAERQAHDHGGQVAGQRRSSRSGRTARSGAPRPQAGDDAGSPSDVDRRRRGRRLRVGRTATARAGS